MFGRPYRFLPETGVSFFIHQVVRVFGVGALSLMSLLRAVALCFVQKSKAAALGAGTALAFALAAGAASLGFFLALPFFTEGRFPPFAFDGIFLP